MFNRSFFACALFSFLASTMIGGPASALTVVPRAQHESADSGHLSDDPESEEIKLTFWKCYQDADECERMGMAGLETRAWHAYECRSRENCARWAALYTWTRK
jgi:hypothetical protein